MKLPSRPYSLTVFMPDDRIEGLTIMGIRQPQACVRVRKVDDSKEFDRLDRKIYPEDKCLEHVYWQLWY